ncbi:MAG TPA: serine hydrolase [Gemmatimonadales bacterium]
MRTLPTYAIALSLALPAAAQQPRLPKNLDAYVQQALATFQVPGVGLAIVKDGKVLLARGYGVRRWGDTAKVDAHTYFQIASNTKAYTTAALSMLADSGLLSWDDPVQQYLPWFQLSDPWVTREFTIRDLVTHRSGLGLGAGDLVWFHSDYPREEVVRRLRYAKPVTSFRSAYAYDNVLYIAAGLVVEAASHQRWDDFIKQRIFTPLGMSEAGTDVSLMSTADAAAPHSLENGKIVIVPLDTVQNTAPAGAIVENVTDAAKWLLAQLDSGRTPAGRALWSPRDTKRMWAAQTILGIGDVSQRPDLAPLLPNFAAYGLGWSLHDYRGHKIATHTGGLAGMTSRTLLVPDQRLGIVLFTNAETDIITALPQWILDRFLGAPPTDWVRIFHDYELKDRAESDSIEHAAAATRDSTSRPSLGLAGYAGSYTDRLYGDATIAVEGDHLVLRFSHSAAFVGDLEHWQHDTFKTHWRTANIADAFVTFTLQPDGSVKQFTMQAVSPLADFSFDYQDLLFEPKSGR